jgi:hypothetical protein
VHEREEIDRQRGTALSHPLPTDTRMESNRMRSVRAEPAPKEVLVTSPDHSTAGSRRATAARVLHRGAIPTGAVVFVGATGRP